MLPIPCWKFSKNLFWSKLGARGGRREGSAALLSCSVICNLDQSLLINHKFLNRVFCWNEYFYKYYFLSQIGSKVTFVLCNSCWGSHGNKWALCSVLVRWEGFCRIQRHDNIISTFCFTALECFLSLFKTCGLLLSFCKDLQKRCPLF